MAVLLLITPLQSDVVPASTFIREVFGSLVGSFAFIFGLMTIGGWLIYFVTKHVTKYKTESNIDRNKVSVIENAIEGIKSDMAYVKGNINILLRIADSQSPIKSKSPVALSTFGEDLAKQMNLEKRISNNWGKIYDCIENNLQSKNAYDVQQFCIETASVSLDKFFSSEDVEYYKNFAFNAGKPLIYYGGMIGVMIRDAYFKHEGIDVLDVDKHDPQKKSS